MRRWGPALIFGCLLGLLARAKGGNLAGLLVGLGAVVMYLALSRLAYLRLARQHPDPPQLSVGEKAILYGPATWTQQGRLREGWAFLTNQQLSLVVTDATSIALSIGEIDEIRPAKRSWRLGGELGVVSKREGLVLLKVPDVKRWELALRRVVRGESEV